MVKTLHEAALPAIDASPERFADGKIDAALRDVVQLYPPELRSEQSADIMRTKMHIGLVASHCGFAARVCDLGGGIGIFTPGCAAQGMKATLVDDFEDEVNYQFSIDKLGVHKKLGVNVVSTDVLGDDLEFPSGSFDAVTTFDSMEHWHNSPKTLFHKVSRWLKPGGLFVLGGPNCVNLRKRLSVPFGHGKWSSMQDWYEAEKFRGHVREPDVEDLRYIAKDMGLTQVRILGRNWLGYQSGHPFIRRVTPMVDRLFQAWPQLCADIYLVGRTASG